MAGRGGRHGKAEDGELVRFDIAPARSAAACRSRASSNASAIRRTSARSSLIAVHAHGIPDVFPARVIEEAEALPPLDGKGREDLTKIPS